MKRKRRHLTAEFKARVAGVALKGEKSINKPDKILATKRRPLY